MTQVTRKLTFRQSYNAHDNGQRLAVNQSARPILVPEWVCCLATSNFFSLMNFFNGDCEGFENCNISSDFELSNEEEFFSFSKTVE